MRNCETQYRQRRNAPRCCASSTPQVLLSDSSQCVHTTSFPRYEIETKLFVYKHVASVSSRSMQYVPLPRASYDFQEMATCSILCDATLKQYNLSVFDGHLSIRTARQSRRPLRSRWHSISAGMLEETGLLVTSTRVRWRYERTFTNVQRDLLARYRNPSQYGDGAFEGEQDESA